MMLKELKDTFSSELKGIYSREESQTILNYILIDALGIPKLTILLQSQIELDKNQSEKALSFLVDLKKGIPVQHLLGKAHFYGMMLEVNADVLIPRQETEELVDWIIKDTGDTKVRILDVCTGSGCIALALKKHLPAADVTAVDISEKALAVARKNALAQNLDINFKKADALKLERDLTDEAFDIIVSNPPYIPLAEKDTVQKSVWMYEPHLALFVPDECPLVFYEAIAKYTTKFNPVSLYFEINEDSGNKLVELMSGLVFKDISIRADLNGKNRMLKCRFFS